MKKNIASQIVGCQLISKTDGSPITSGTTTVYVTGDGTQTTGSVGSGAATHKGHGYWEYSPSQAETNFDHVAFTFENASGINATPQMYPSFPQTGDNFARIGAPVGASLSADIAAVQADTDNMQTRIPAALVGGRMDASVGVMAANVITAAATAADFATEVTAGLSTLDAAGVRTAVGLGSADLDTQLSSINAKTTNLPSDPADQSLIIAATDAVMTRIGVAGAGLSAIPWNVSWDAEVQSECADALNAYDAPTKAELDAAVASIPGDVWDEAIAGHSTGGTTGGALLAAGSAGDPWSTALPGSYGAGTAGKIVGDNINATIASRATPAQVNVECDAAIADAALATAANLATVIAKTNQMVFTTANQINATVVTNSDKAGYVLSAAGSAALTEGYAADGAIATLPQLLYMILALLSEKSIVGTTLTAKKLDGVTTAATFTLDDVSPTAISRTT